VKGRKLGEIGGTRSIDRERVYEYGRLMFTEIKTKKKLCITNVQGGGKKAQEWDSPE